MKWVKVIYDIYELHFLDWSFYMFSFLRTKLMCSKNMFYQYNHIKFGSGSASTKTVGSHASGSGIATQTFWIHYSMTRSIHQLYSKPKNRPNFLTPFWQDHNVFNVTLSHMGWSCFVLIESPHWYCRPLIVLTYPTPHWPAFYRPILTYTPHCSASYHPNLTHTTLAGVLSSYFKLPLLGRPSIIGQSFVVPL